MLDSGLKDSNIKKQLLFLTKGATGEASGWGQQCKRVVAYPWLSLAIWPRQHSVCEPHPPRVL